MLVYWKRKGVANNANVKWAGNLSKTTKKEYAMPVFLLNFQGKRRQKMLSTAPGDALTAENIHPCHKYFHTCHFPETLLGTSMDTLVMVLQSHKSDEETETLWCSKDYIKCWSLSQKKKPIFLGSPDLFQCYCYYNNGVILARMYKHSFMSAYPSVTLGSYAVVHILGPVIHVDIFLLVAVIHRGLNPDCFFPLPHKACLLQQKPEEKCSDEYFLS